MLLLIWREGERVTFSLMLAAILLQKNFVETPYIADVASMGRVNKNITEKYHVDSHPITGPKKMTTDAELQPACYNLICSDYKNKIRV